MEEYQKPELFSAVKNSFVKMMQEIHKQEKVKIEYLGICYLISGLVSGTYELLLGAYDESFYLDKSPVEYYVRIPLFYEWYERDATEVMEILKEDFIRIQEWEKDLIRRELIQYYYAAMCKLFIDWKEPLMQIPEVKILYDKNPFLFYFGRYQGEGVIL